MDMMASGGRFSKIAMASSVISFLAINPVWAQEPPAPPPTAPIVANVANLDQPTGAISAAPVATPNAAIDPAPTVVPTNAIAANVAPAAVDPAPVPAIAETSVKPVADPIVLAVVERLRRPVAGTEKSEVAALAQFYAKRAGPLFLAGGAWSPIGEAVIAELARADNWGLVAKSYAVAAPSAADLSQLAEAEVALAAAALRYARHASGGRVDPATLSRFNDMRGTDADPVEVLTGLAAANQPTAFLLSLHPKHPQYQKLHAALVKLRNGGSPPPEATTQSAVVLLPAEGPTLKAGATHKDVALLRARLAGPGEAANETFDTPLTAAVKSFQAEKGLKRTGALDKATRAALSGAEPAKKSEPSKDIEQIALNMERWRWMPRDLGAFHIVNNVPEFQTRVVKDGEVIHQERIIVGKANTPTPVFSANMQFVIFHPEWGVPDSIKVKEIWPSLRRKAPDDFFGTTSDTRLLQRQNMRVTYNGRVIDASKVDWSTADPRQYSFIQAAGGGNVLGVVKFRFPNKHDVYMHDTQERSLFQQSARAYSHGCMRVNNPRRLAEVILAHAETPAWTPDRVGAALASTGTQEIKLDRPFPVHSVYLTAWVDEATGKVSTFSDLYGHDTRLTAALAGRPVSVEPQESKNDLSGSIRQQIDRKKQQKQDVDPLSAILSGIFSN